MTLLQGVLASLTISPRIFKLIVWITFPVRALSRAAAAAAVD